MPVKDLDERRRKDRAYRSKVEVRERDNAQARSRYANGGKAKKAEYDRKRRAVPEVMARRAVYLKQRRIAKWAKARIAEIRCRARSNGIPFDLAESDLHMPETCPVFGTKLVVSGARNDAPSVDRIIPERGYVRGNIVVVSNRANSLKREASLDDLRKLLAFYTPLIERN